ncbi:GRAS family protein [Hyalangium versicolor]|uniref:GRAS family protein n=1 Tax=Hyalangium versicolor TaxID=2861190 RepID=UPI001CCD7D9C|nr:GRAS family protein [Hyalangium versicolor]
MDSPKLELLTQGLEEVIEGRPDDARKTLASLRGRLDVDAFPEDMQYLIFAAALSRRLSGTAADEFNLYLRRYEHPQINLFSLLASRLPLVPMAGTIANELIAALVRGHDTFTLLDVGIGVGRQEVALLNALAASNSLPRHVTIVGVEPGEGSLRAAEESLTATARGLGVGLRFIGLPQTAETLSEEHWAMLGDLPGPRVVNSAFSMHHIAWRPEGEDLRDAFFRRLCQWAPTGVVLCEPNSNHHRSAIRERFHNCWRHFYFTFQLLEELDIPRQEKNTIKVFFAREVEDIVSTLDEQQRSERHENASAWVERLVRSGFQPEEMQGRQWSAAHPAVTLRPQRGYVGLEYRDETIVAVLCATGAGARP